MATSACYLLDLVTARSSFKILTLSGLHNRLGALHIDSVIATLQWSLSNGFHEGLASDRSCVT